MHGMAAQIKASRNSHFKTCGSLITYQRPQFLCPRPVLDLRKFINSRNNGFAVLHASLDDSSNSTRSAVPVAHEVDPDLYGVLSLASDEELESIYNSLYDTSLLSPLGKSLQTASPAAVHYTGRDALIRRIERRYRFLAADAESTLKGTFPSYRASLLAIHSRLGVPCPTELATHDLEAEIFLFLLKEHADAVDSAAPSAANAAEHVHDGDGMASGASSTSQSRPNIFQKAFAPLKLGAKEVIPTLTRFGATLAVTNIHVNIAKQLGAVLVNRTVQYETATQLATAAGNAVASRATMRAAQRGLTAAASRYAAARSVLSVVGPILWAMTAVDLAKMSIGCDYARLVRAIFQLAQIRLLRTDGWVSKEQY